MHEITKWIETSFTLMMSIDLFLLEWEKIRKREIASLIYKEELHLEHAQYHDFEDLMIVHDNWKSALGKS